MLQQRNRFWLASLWICDAAAIERESARQRPAWTTACGPLTILARSEEARRAAHCHATRCPGPVEVRLAGNRAETCLELARFAASMTMPYVHVVAGTFHYQREMARLACETLAKARPDVATVDVARLDGGSYTFPARLLCERYGLSTDREQSLSDPELASVLIQRDTFQAAVDPLMRVPPDAGWLAIALARFLAGRAPPMAIPLLLGAHVADDRVGDGAGWTSHAAAVVEDVLAAAGCKTAGEEDWPSLARQLIALARLLAVTPCLSPALHDFVEERADRLAPALIERTLGAAARRDQGMLELYIHLSDAMGLEGPEALELVAEEGIEFLRRQLADFAVLAGGGLLASIAGQVAAAGVSPTTGDHLRSATLRLKQAERERRQFRASAAIATDQLLMERYKLRQMRARYENAPDQDDAGFAVGRMTFAQVNHVARGQGS